MKALRILPLLFLIPSAGAGEWRFAVNEYFGVEYAREPVSFDVEFKRPVDAGRIIVEPGPCQVEVVEGTPRAVEKARVWTLVDFDPSGYVLSEGDVSDSGKLVSRINAELTGKEPTLGKLLWKSLRSEFNPPRGATALKLDRIGPDERAAIVRALNGFITRSQRYDPRLIEALGLDKKLPALAGTLKGKLSAESAQKVNRLALEAAYPGLIARHKEHPRQRIYVVRLGSRGSQPPGPTISPAGKVGGVEVAVFANDLVKAKVPVGSARFEPPASPFGLPGPVVTISRDGKEWVGSGYIDSTRKVRSITCKTSQGPVYAESDILYEFEGGRTYRARVRLFVSKPCVRLVGDFDLGGASRFVFNYDDWTTDGFIRMGDNNPGRFAHPVAEENPCGDFIRVRGQKALARLVVWSQFNYFGGKQEVIGLKAPAPEAARAFAKGESYRFQHTFYDRRARARRTVTEEVRLVDHELDGAVFRAPDKTTPPRDETCVGGFYIRPDRWTRAKLNHVDLYLRPEVPGDRRTRGVVGLKGAKVRAAMEAWLADGHREWAVFAVPAGQHKTVVTKRPKGQSGPPRVSVEWAYNDWLKRAHVLEGVWPLDRIIRLPLVWNADGSRVRPEETAPRGPLAHGGGIRTVLLGTRGRSGLQYFNGSNGHMRGTMGGPSYLKWAREHPRVKASQVEVCDKMVGWAMMAYMAMDESAYPGRRAMLPWTHPEALNPFYQGMENMNFNADRYRVVSMLGAGLAALNHPEGKRILAHGQEQMHMALDRYVYPRSGCWEESHGYCAHTMKNLIPLANLLREFGLKDFYDDIRFARMFEFWCRAHSPRDPAFEGRRYAPPIGDHGLRVGEFNRQFQDALGHFAKSRNPEIRKTASHMAWLLGETGGQVPEGVAVKAVEPDLRSQWLQGYGAVMRAVTRTKNGGQESYLVLRAGQSWGHHHEDKGSMWFWGRGVQFFGDAERGSPPGGTYWNKYKQGPASGTQIEFVGVTNWTLPCKYAAPWISDEEFGEGFDYANARCRYPFNPKLDLSRSTPVALTNGYDRQVLFVHPDVVIVRDNVETVCPTIWRLHSYQPAGTTLRGNTATLASPYGATGELAILSPASGVKLQKVDRDDLNPYYDKTGKPLPYDQRPKFKHTACLKWEMPPCTSATWAFGVHGKGEPAPRFQALEPAGRVVRATLPDGREAIVFLNRDPFAYEGHGVEFEGTVGLVVRRDGRTLSHHAVRAAKLKVAQ